MQVNWNDVKEDYKRKDEEIQHLKAKLSESKKTYASSINLTLKTLDRISSSINDIDADQSLYTLYRRLSDLRDEINE